ncbi:MAG: hypothetical protein AABW57_01285 [Nanoarchaeota archaeon]
MLFTLISFLGLVIGVILSREFKNELKDIKKFLRIINLIIILIIILRLLLLIKFDLVFLIGLIIGILINYLVKNNYLYFGSILMSSNFMNDINKIFFSILIFVIGLIYPALNNINKKKIIISFILFALPFILLLTNLSYNNFILGFSIGGLAVGFNRYK